MELRDLAAQYRALRPAVDAAVLSVLEDGRYIGGPAVRRLEEKLAEFVGVGHCVSCANGTDALQLALMAWGVGPGDAVFVPDFTFFASAEAVAAVGATPVFVDVDERAYTISPASLEHAVRAVEAAGVVRPRAVMTVDLFGLPADHAAVGAVGEAHGLIVLEDGAQGFGGSAHGRRACAFGSMATTSFFPAKPLGCYGDGGAVFTDNGDWAELVRSYAAHGRGSSKYHNVRVGMNSRLDAVQAAVLLAKLEAFVSHECAAAQEAALLYEVELARLPLGLPVVPEGYRSAWAQYTVRLLEGCDRERVRACLRARDIPTMVYYPRPLHRQPAFRGTCLCPDGCPVTERLCERVLSLPMGPYLASDDVRAVAQALHEALG